MKTLIRSVAALILLALPAFATAGDPPPACSVSVEIINRLGVYRTWTNAFENSSLAEKGLTACQDEDSLGKCETEFKFELKYRPNSDTRYVIVSQGKKSLFTLDYPASPSSQRIMRTLPTCADLQARAAAIP